MYQDPIILKLIEKLNAEGPAKLKNKYYIGDPLVVAESLLPICFITKDTTEISTDTNATDRHELNLVLNVVYKFTQDLNHKAFVQAGTSGLYELCEARGADYSLRTDTIAHVLRKYETLDAANELYIDMDTPLEIDYQLSPPSRRGIFSAEALIKTKLHATTPFPGIGN